MSKITKDMGKRVYRFSLYRDGDPCPYPNPMRLNLWFVACDDTDVREQLSTFFGEYVTKKWMVNLDDGRYFVRPVKVHRIWETDFARGACERFSPEKHLRAPYYVQIDMDTWVKA